MSDQETQISSAQSDGGDEEIIYAFSSVSRELYTQDIYNSLALPPGFTVEFRYRKPWYNDSIVQSKNDDELVGKDAVIIAAPFTPYESDADVARDVQNGESKYGYYPLRRAEIVDVRNPGNVLYLTLELTSRLVEYDDNSSPTAKDEETDDPWEIESRLNSYPKFGVEGDNYDIFLTSGQDIFSYSNRVDGESQQETWTGDHCEESWNSIIRELGDTESLSKSLRSCEARCW